MCQVAIIMSVYKNDKLEYLKESLNSLYEQTTKADIFIQEDGKLPEELETYIDNELEVENICYLGKRDENLGLASSLNELLRMLIPKYKYIVRMDADDISVPTRVEKQVAFLEKNRDIQALGGWIEEFNIDINQKQIVRYGEYHDELKRNL